jgi:2-phosphoglycolate phosphatase
MGAARAVAFDLDGTLIDSVGDIAASANHMLRSQGLPELSVDEVAGYVGDGARLLVARCVRLPLTPAELTSLVEMFLDYYAAHPTEHTRLMPGAQYALDALSSYRLAVCTNKPRRTTDAVLPRLLPARHFELVVAGGDLPRAKPDPQPLLFIAERFGVDPTELVMVGDSPQDIACGRAAGTRTVGVLGGFAPRDQLRAAHPDALLGSLYELPTLLSSWAEEAT